MMRVTFVLPGSGQDPYGGAKVVYEYANGLVQRGANVTVIHSPYGLIHGMTARQVLKRPFVYLGRRLGMKGGFLPTKWFQIDPRVNMVWAPSLAEGGIPDADRIVATSWETAEWVASYGHEKGKKYYLIQHLESNFQGTNSDRVLATWRFPLQKIVIARWLEAIAQDLGESSRYIPNGLDFSTFGLDVPIVDRNPSRLIMLYHNADWKGSANGLRAIHKAKEKAPELTGCLFGVPAQPSALPPWITYYRRPTQHLLRKLYNEAAIFIGPSWAEGWPLPPAEAMQCGAALCVTDIGGHREYASHEQTALLSPSRNPGLLAEQILRLINDDELRVGIASRGQAFIQQFTWDRAVSAFLDLLME